MNVFRTLAYLAPLAVGFGVAAALALTRGRPVRRRLVAALCVLGVVVAALGLAAFAESAGAFMAVSMLMAGFALLTAGFFLFCEACGLPAGACQVAAGLVVAGLLGTAFLFGPVLRQAEESGMPMEDISRRITRTLEVNPFMVTGCSVFGRDPTHWRTFYPLGLADYPSAPPRWRASAAGYALAGFAFFAGAVLLAALRRGVGACRRRWGGGRAVGPSP